jgi:phage-related protein
MAGHHAHTRANYEAMSTSAKAETVGNELAHNAHNTVKAEASGVMKDLFTPGTTLGDARVKDIGSEAAREAGSRQARAGYEAVSAQAARVEAATAQTLAAEQNKLLDTITQNIEAATKENIARKVDNISWVKRLNPFAADLHLTGKQKGVAFVAGAAVLSAGALITGKLAQMLTRDSSSHEK